MMQEREGKPVLLHHASHGKTAPVLVRLLDLGTLVMAVFNKDREILLVGFAICSRRRCTIDFGHCCVQSHLYMREVVSSCGITLQVSRSYVQVEE